jgi:ectoine hydroxylase-related dioxygenase (phytanoyl-CoA dioxygenase family)
MLSTFSRNFTSLFREIIEKFYLTSWPTSDFKTYGYEVIENFLSEEECDYFVNLSNSLLKDESYMINDNAWLTLRKDADDGLDTKVAQLNMLQNVDEKAKDLFTNGDVLDLFSKRIKEELAIRSLSIMVDQPDTSTKRSWHVDNLAPASFKAFIYLTDVTKNTNSPFSVIAKSHRWGFRRWLTSVINSIRGNTLSDMLIFSPKGRGTELTAPKGSLILSNQIIFHRGSPYHTENTRYMMVFYLRRKKDTKEEFTLGKPK